MVDDPRRVADPNALLLRLLAYVLLTGAGLAILLAWGLTRLPLTEHDGVSLYVMPGSAGRRLIDAKAISVMACAGLVLGAIGLSGILFGGLVSARLGASAVQADRENPIHSTRHRPLVILVVGGITLLSVLAWRWVRPDGSVSSPPPLVGSVQP